MGPPLMDGTDEKCEKKDFASAQILHSFFECEQIGLMKTCRSMVDVRDVAMAHLKAIEVGEAKN